MRYLLKSIFILALISMVFSCRKEKILTDSSAKLDFSQDTVSFDTVFTTVGSTTHNFLIYNRHNQPITISSIKLAGGQNSNFRINVDGISTTAAGNITIPAKDSLYIFVEVTVDPNNQNSPLVIRDSITFMTNGNFQRVLLEAWGQDANYIKPNIFPTNGFPPYSIITENDTTWSNSKPFVIYGYAVIDSGAILHIQAGTKIYMHNDAVLWVYKDGSLQIEGQQGNPVIIQGDRLEPDYQDIAGQWGKIWLSAESENNVIKWAVIKNGSIGIQADTVNNWNTPTLEISNTVIKNMSSAALFAQGSFIKGSNCVFADCQQYAMALTIGGKYTFNQCTIADYWSSSYTATSRQTPALLLNNWYKDVNGNIQYRNLDSAYFGNCIVYGDQDNEVGLDSAGNGAYNVKFDHCLIKSTLNTSSGFHYNTVYKNQDPDFADYSNDDYNIGVNSAARGKGDPTIGAMYPTDLNGNQHTAPDLGAYEYKP